MRMPLPFAHVFDRLSVGVRLDGVKQANRVANRVELNGGEHALVGVVDRFPFLFGVPFGRRAVHQGKQLLLAETGPTLHASLLELSMEFAASAGWSVLTDRTFGGAVVVCRAAKLLFLGIEDSSTFAACR